MDPDNYQQAWQAHSSRTRITIDANVLLKEVERSQRNFRAMIFWRDFREVGVAVLLLPVWFYLGARFSLPWTWYLVVPALVWVAGFILVDRMRHNQQANEPGEPLHQSVKESLTQVEHQIWLLRNVFWWYLLPFTISLMAFFVQVSSNWWDTLGQMLFVVVLYAGIYFLNQRVVRTCLEPRRQELLTLLTSLEDETNSGQYSRMKSAENVKKRGNLLRTLFVTCLCVVALAALCAAAFFAGQTSAGYPKRAPYTGVRWEGYKPIVQIGEDWFTLVSVDGIATSDIVGFSRRTYRDKWQMRFEEDLVEVLTKMGHEPKHAVRLVVSPLGSRATRTLENVPMTEANRRVIKAAAMSRKPGEKQKATRSSVPIGDADASLTDLVAGLREEKQLVGLAAMVMVDGKVVASAVDGERKNWSGVWLEIGDRWHLGGISKSITATMIARLVESGRMKWSDTIGEIFPGASVHEHWKPVTLRQLLTDTAGAPANFPKDVWYQRPALGFECTEARREAVLNLIAHKPTYPPGKQFAYSSVGYTIAGAMAEKVTGATWEDLMKREVFEPLELNEAGFGPPKSADETLQQPRGHQKVVDGKIAVNDAADNTPIIGPAATIHMTLQNLCNFAREHLQGERGKGKLLSAETYKKLHTPELDDYACGWLGKQPNKEIPYTAYWHNGTNTMWYALVVFIPDKNMVVAVTSNDGDYAEAEVAAWEIVKASANGLAIKAEAQTPENGEP
jgi:CubicO group peptidase (beta-lactamase class C family)